MGARSYGSLLGFLWYSSRIPPPWQGAGVWRLRAGLGGGGWIPWRESKTPKHASGNLRADHGEVVWDRVFSFFMPVYSWLTSSLSFEPPHFQKPWSFLFCAASPGLPMMQISRTLARMKQVSGDAPKNDFMICVWNSWHIQEQWLWEHFSCAGNAVALDKLGAVCIYSYTPGSTLSSSFASSMCKFCWWDISWRRLVWKEILLLWGEIHPYPHLLNLLLLDYMTPRFQSSLLISSLSDSSTSEILSILLQSSLAFMFHIPRSLCHSLWYTDKLCPRNSTFLSSILRKISSILRKNSTFLSSILSDVECLRWHLLHWLWLLNV